MIINKEIDGKFDWTKINFHKKMVLNQVDIIPIKKRRN